MIRYGSEEVAVRVGEGDVVADMLLVFATILRDAMNGYAQMANFQPVA